MKDNFGLGAFGLDTIDYPEAGKSKLANTTLSFEDSERLRIEIEHLEAIKKYYEEHPDAKLPSCDFGHKEYRDEKGSIVKEITYRGRGR